MRDVVSYVIMDRIGTLTAAFTAAVTNIITSAAHGLKNGDMVVLTTTTTLPAGLALATVYYVRNSATDTFKLAATKDGPEIDITDTGTGTHTFTMHDIGNNIFCRDFRHAVISFESASSANLTAKCVGSIGDSVANPDSCPDFSATQSKDNSWDYVYLVDQDTKIPTDGSTGIVLSGTDVHNHYLVDIDGLDWLNFLMTAWSAGNVTIRIRLYND